MPPPKNVPMASVAQVCSGTPRVLINVFPQAKYTVSLSVAFHYCIATIHLLFHVLSSDLEDLACSSHCGWKRLPLLPSYYGFI